MPGIVIKLLVGWDNDNEVVGVSSGYGLRVEVGIRFVVF